MSDVKVKVNITNEDGEILEQITIVSHDDDRFPSQLASAIVKTLENKYDTDE